MTNKIAILYAGAGGCGKSTTTKAFVQGEPKEYRRKELFTVTSGRQHPVIWTLYDNCGLVGTHTAGTDACQSPGIIEISFYECMKERSVVLVDGMMSSPRWVTMVTALAKEQPKNHFSIMLVHFNLTAEEVLTRLAARRKQDKEDIREKMYPKCVGLVARADHLIRHIYSLWAGDIWCLEICENDRTPAIVAAMRRMIKDIQNG